MKKPKLTKQEKAEIRKENTAWKDFIRRMKNRGALIEEETIDTLTSKK